MLTEKQLFNLKDQIEQANNALNQLTGKKQILLKTLKTDFKCNSLEDAKEKLSDYDGQIKEITKEIKDLSIKIESQLEVE